MHDPYMDMFEKRLKRIARAQRRAKLFAASRRHAMPRGTMLLAIVLALATSKGAAMASLGPDLYAERLMALRAGTAVQRVSAVIMVPDPMSREIARLITPMLR